MMLILWCFLLLTHFLCHVHPQECDTKWQYKDDNNVRCCKKCESGQHMVKRCTKSSETSCTKCRRDLYMDEYNKELECKRCSQCTKEHMVYKKNCSSISDAVCDCESGYKCNGKPCTDCVKIPTTTTTTTTTAPPSTPTTTTTTSKVITNVIKETTASQDTVWITLSLCCVCILLTCFILISRHTPPCGWIMLASAGSFGGSKKTSAESSQCTEDEEVPMPVQEVCGHKEWEEEV
ncbi:tumor necrosis factor receptor superfamily member 5 isoform X2 [Ictalurus furcatus]|uniref:tumor necrosis factor receptor superfamily member 5 isoform X2 n=1 Tax=Ictalurus furcatus TaxID=66913 RepID=UPI00235005AF|nr:tumor necrosis factor receptor superfamily member 5 isoform X2 [Ictalurus furcatus]